ncbi:MAG: hypothetical protein D4R64_15985 [Porphyromonadaceae bacterium]|nr:MAG: hypothetical protein D4R64_15985 [Porphyromonadaceae bacterium]
MWLSQSCSHKGSHPDMDTWQQSMLSSQEVLVLNNQDSISKGKALVQVGPWYSTRPIDDVLVEENWSDPKFDISFFNEGRSANILFFNNPDLTAKDADGKSIWQELQNFHDAEPYYWQNNSLLSVYLYRTIFVPVACTIKGIFRAGASDIRFVVLAAVAARFLRFGSTPGDEMGICRRHLE